MSNGVKMALTTDCDEEKGRRKMLNAPKKRRSDKAIGKEERTRAARKSMTA